MTRTLFAVDANFLMDLAEPREVALDALEIIRRRLRGRRTEGRARRREARGRRTEVRRQRPEARGRKRDLRRVGFEAEGRLSAMPAFPAAAEKRPASRLFALSVMLLALFMVFLGIDE